MAPKQEWLIIIPDVPGTLDKRLEVRPKHLENLTPHVKSGTVVFGGATLDSPLKEGEKMQSNGSGMVVLCETEKEARELVEGDIYAKEGIWDISKLQIWPFKSAVRQAL